MARRDVTQFFDDLDNTPLNEEDLHIVHFGVEGTNYVLDLSADHAQEFHRLLGPYIHAARTVTPTRTPRRENLSTRGNSRAIRQWAQDQGLKVADRGKIPHEIIGAYNQAHD